MIGLRSPLMGTDLLYGSEYGYLGTYKSIANMNWKEIFTTNVANYEKGYVIFNKILSYISTNPQFLLIVCALICGISVSYFIYKNSKLPFLSTIIYLGLPCFLINFSGLRQALAIAITLFAVPFIQKKKIIPFVLIVIFASFFHLSAIIFLLAYPVYYIKSEKVTIAISIGVIPVLYIFRYPVFELLSKFFKENVVLENNSSLTLFLVFFAIYIFTILLGHQNDSKEVGYRNLFWLACFCQTFSGVYSLAMRVGYYFMVYLVLLLPEVLSIKNENSSLMQKRIKIILYIIILICFATFGFYSLYKESWAMTNPYHFFWEN